MMHPHLPGPRPLAVPGIGFPQNISIGSDVRAPAALEIRRITTVVPQRDRSTASFGSHRYGNGLRPLAPDFRTNSGLPQGPADPPPASS